MIDGGIKWFTSSGFIKVFLRDEQEGLLFLGTRQGCRVRMSGSKHLIHLLVLLRIPGGNVDWFYYSLDLLAIRSLILNLVLKKIIFNPFIFRSRPFLYKNFPLRKCFNILLLKKMDSERCKTIYFCKFTFIRFGSYFSYMIENEIDRDYVGSWRIYSNSIWYCSLLELTQSVQPENQYWF